MTTTLGRRTFISSRASRSRNICWLLAAGLGAISIARAENIPPNSTLFVTVGTSSFFPFSERPVPQDFFFPGSPPLNEDVHVRSVPLVMHRGFFVGVTDTVIAQLEEAMLDGPGSTDTVAMQLAALSLGSLSPVTVGDTQWNVHMGLSSTVPTMGSMTITQTSIDGGVWEGSLAIFVAATFSEVGNPGNVRVLDTGTAGFPPLMSATTGPMPWSHVTPPEFAVVPGLTRNFFTAGHKHTKEGHEEMQATRALIVPPTPAVSGWGMGTLALLLLSGVAIKFGRRAAAIA